MDLVYGSTLSLNAYYGLFMDLSSNKILFSLLLIDSLWAPVYLIRKAYAFSNRDERTLANYAIVLAALAGLVVVYGKVLDFDTRIMLGVPSAILVLAYLAVTLIQKLRNRGDN